jgi:hypothetical protein
MNESRDLFVGFLLPAVLVFFITVFLLVLRLLQHRERMAMIARGLVPPGTAAPSRLQTGAVTTGVGAALTLGMLTIGIGPWLVAGLVPLFVGLGLLLVNLRES